MNPGAVNKKSGTWIWGLKILDLLFLFLFSPVSLFFSVLIRSKPKYVGPGSFMSQAGMYQPFVLLILLWLKSVRRSKRFPFMNDKVLKNYIGIMCTLKNVYLLHKSHWLLGFKSKHFYSIVKNKKSSNVSNLSSGKYEDDLKYPDYPMCQSYTFWNQARWCTVEAWLVCGGRRWETILHLVGLTWQAL